MTTVLETHVKPEILTSNREESESLVEYAERLSLDHIRNSSIEDRKVKGQFFTPKEVANFMAGLFRVHKRTTLSLLDPGAGTGILAAAFCDRLSRLQTRVNLSIDVYENDPLLFPCLENVMRECQQALEEKGHEVKVNVSRSDFIVDNTKFFTNDTLPFWETERPAFDCIISNPPYYKLNVASTYAKVMRQFALGQPNIYAFFMALSLRLLKDNGEMVFITPRSFCSGLYYRKFRGWFLENAAFSHIHVFESRKEVFEHEGVLQENVILKVNPKMKKQMASRVKITISKNHSFKNIEGHSVPAEHIVHRMKEDALIKIPTSQLHIQIQRAIKDWKYTLHDLGLEVSTGPVVDFRARELLTDLVEGTTTVPLIWMHNIQGMKVVWPVKKNGKQAGMRITEESKPLLLPVKNYVLIKRFSSKEQERRLYAGVFLQREFEFNAIGIENHVNYLYRLRGNLTPSEAIGIAALLNTSLVDEYFRCLNGNTQVNASDLRVLPFPSLDVVEKVGTVVAVKQPAIGAELNEVVAEVLGISERIVRNLNGKER